MSAKDATMSAKDAAMSAKVRDHERQGRDHERQGRDHERHGTVPAKSQNNARESTQLLAHKHIPNVTRKRCGDRSLSEIGISPSALCIMEISNFLQNGKRTRGNPRSCMMWQPKYRKLSTG